MKHATRQRLEEAARKGTGVRLDPGEVVALLDQINVTVTPVTIDPFEVLTPDAVRLDVAQERVAVALSLCEWNVPEAVAPMFGRSETDVRSSWGSNDEYAGKRRNLFRRRAAALLDAYAGRF